jgi:hypothetical protein
MTAAKSKPRPVASPFGSSSTTTSPCTNSSSSNRHCQTCTCSTTAQQPASEICAIKS